MSLLDVIKNLFCNTSCKEPEIEQENKASAGVEEESPSAAEVNSEPVAEEKPEVTEKTEVTEVVTPEPVVASISVPAVEKVARLQIPEDATLKRHFLSALKAEIETGMAPRPSDSTLKRHYDAAVQAKLQSMLD